MRDPTQSEDDVIRYFVKQYSDLQKSFSNVAAYIKAYSSKVEQPAPRGPAISLQEHYSMLDEEDCGCHVCAEWTQRREEFIRASKIIPKGHKWSVCSCNDCRFVGRFQLNLLAAANRRELLIEMSFHARYHSRHGHTVMRWIVQEMAQPSYTDNWCAQEMNRFPMERWLQRCESAVSGVVGGPVFINSTMVTDLITHFGSSLNADVDASHLL